MTFLRRNQRPPTSPTVPFKWRDRDGHFHHPSTMPTRHLFYTVRIIWNNKMPQEARFPDAKLYEFSAFYTDVYLKQAIAELVRELTRRDNLEGPWKAQLRFMYEYLRDNPLELESDKHDL